MRKTKQDPAAPSITSPEDLWGVRRVAKRLDVNDEWVYVKAASGELPSLKVGKYLRFRPAAIEAWLERQSR